MTGRTSACERVLAHASLYLDGRLEDAVRLRVQAHLKHCPDCVGEYRAIRRLSIASRDLPRIAPPANLARRVRRTVAARRDVTLQGLVAEQAGQRVGRRRTMRRLGAWNLVGWAAALICLIGGALWVGYRWGRHDVVHDVSVARDASESAAEIESSSGEPTGTSLAPIARGDRVVEPREYVDDGSPALAADFDESLFQRASRSVIGDLAVIDRIEEGLRRPLLLSQLEYFDLPRSADRCLAPERSEQLLPYVELAGFIRDVHSSLAMDDSTGSLQDLRREILERDLLHKLPATVPAPSTRRDPEEGPRKLRAIVRRVAPSLDAPAAEELCELLQLKDSWVHGVHVDSIQVAFERSRKTSGSFTSEDPLAASFDITLASNLSELGLDRMARNFTSTFQEEVRELVVVGSSKGFPPEGVSFSLPLRAETLAGGFHRPEDLMAEIMRLVGGDPNASDPTRAFSIEEEGRSPDGTMVRILIRTTKQSVRTTGTDRQ